MTTGPFDGIRVLDFSRYIAGPLCAAMLGDLGAEVIRIEPPDGGDDRTVMPVSPSVGALFLGANRNKRSLPIDLKRPENRSIVERLVAMSDVVVTNMPGRALARLGLDYQSLRAINPRIVHTNVTAFGDEGPERDSIGFDGTGQAMSGAAYLSGHGEPTRSAVSYVDFGTALACAFGTVSALYQRQRTGEGQEVSGSLIRTSLMMMNPILIEQALGARTRVATGNRSPIAGPSDIFRTSDGWIMVQVIGQDMFARWVAVVGAPELLADPRFADDVKRGENGEVLSAVMRSWCEGRSSGDCLSVLRANRIPGCRVLSPAEALTEPQHTEGGMFEWVDRPTGPGVLPIVLPVHFASGDASVRSTAPEVGEGAVGILRGIGLSDAEIAGLGIDPSEGAT